MSSFSVTGLNSGLDYNAIIKRILDVARRPAYRLAGRQEEYRNTISVYGDISEKLSALNDLAEKLGGSAGFNLFNAASSDESVLDVSASTSATAGNFSVTNITSLAQGEKELHSGVADTATVVNSSGADLAFQYSYAGTQRTITVPDGATLADLKGLINNDSGNPGVSASILYDGSSHRLVLTGNDTGSGKTITIDAGTTLDGTGSVDFRSTEFTEAMKAQGAAFMVDGIAMTRSTNLISDIYEGVSITLKKASLAGEAATVSISRDSEAIKANIEEFVNAYNEIVSLISDKSLYDSEAKSGGPLTGDSTARSILSGLRGVIIKGVGGLPQGMSALSNLGISSGRDGKLSLDSTVLEERLASDLEGASDIFGAAGGISEQMTGFIDKLTDSVDGRIVLRKKSLESMISAFDKDIERIEARLDRLEEDLTRQFAGLEGLIGTLNAQGSFLMNQLNAWS
jgi:flagellar hook-associated protein 2